MEERALGRRWEEAWCRRGMGIPEMGVLRRNMRTEDYGCCWICHV